MNPKKVREYVYEIEPEMKVIRHNNKIYNFKMAVPAVVYANDTLIEYCFGRFVRPVNKRGIPSGYQGKKLQCRCHKDMAFPLAGSRNRYQRLCHREVGYDINCGVDF